MCTKMPYLRSLCYIEIYLHLQQHLRLCLEDLGLLRVFDKQSIVFADCSSTESKEGVMGVLVCLHVCPP